MINHVKIANIIVKKLSSLQDFTTPFKDEIRNLAVCNGFYGRRSPTRRSKTANITKDDITS